MAYANGYDYRRLVTIDGSKVAGSSHSNFPVLIDITLDSSHVTSASGYDVTITDDSDTELAFELERYDSGTGRWIGWAKIPTLSGSVDTDLYVYYGNSGVTTDQSSTSVWADYDTVYHLRESGSGSSNEFKDSTANANHATATSSIRVPAQTAGKIGYGQSYVNADNDRIVAGSALGADIGTRDFTMSMWANISTWANYTAVMLNGSIANHGIPFAAITTRAQNEAFISVNQTGGGSRITQRASFGSVSASLLNAEHYYVGVREGDTLKAYLNGALVDTYTLAADYNVNTPGALQIGSGAFGGVLDEVRQQVGTARSADWIATEYANQNSPSTFYAVDTEEAGGAPSPFKRYNGSSWVEVIAEIM